MAGTTGLEPATSAVTGQRSNQLSYVPNYINQQPPVAPDNVYAYHGILAGLSVITGAYAQHVREQILCRPCVRGGSDC